MTDDQVIRRCLSGTPEAYRTLVERHVGEVRAFLISRLGPGRFAEEAATEAFTRGWLALRSLRKPEAFGSWIKGIALRVAREGARGRPTGRDAADRPQPVVCGDAALREAVRSLHSPYREVIELRYFAGLRCDEIARRTGVPVGTVTKQLSRAYAALREALADAEPRSAEVSR